MALINQEVIFCHQQIERKSWKHDRTCSRPYRPELGSWSARKCVCVCTVLVYIYEGCMSVYIWRGKDYLGCHLFLFYFIFCQQSSQESACLCLPGTGITSMCHHTELFTFCKASGIELWSSCLKGKHSLGLNNLPSASVKCRRRPPKWPLDDIWPGIHNLRLPHFERGLDVTTCSHRRE